METKDCGSSDKRADLAEYYRQEIYAAIDIISGTAASAPIKEGWEGLKVLASQVKGPRQLWLMHQELREVLAKETGADCSFAVQTDALGSKRTFKNLEEFYAWWGTLGRQRPAAEEPTDGDC